MVIVKCWIEHPVRSLDQTFSYLCEEPVQRGCRVNVPFGTKTLVGFVEEVIETEQTKEEYEKETGFTLKSVLSVMDSEPLISDELHDLAMYMKEITISTTISCFQTMLPNKIRPHSGAKKAVVQKWVRISDTEASLTPKQLEAYLYVKDNGPMTYTELRKKYPSQASVLITKGALTAYEKERRAMADDLHISATPYPLSEEQKHVIEEIEGSEDLFYLLKGVTGSGKTEVYLQLAEHVLREGRQVLFLVPEISLTPQMISRVRKRFGDYLAVYHSGLNDQEKYEQYQLVRQGRAGIVVGTRSAVFLPFENLGLIIMDEEHDSSYKQDSQPAYHARDIAMFRCRHHGAKLIMGSATPSLDSYARGLKNVYHLVRMDHRVNDCLPDIHVVNMREAMEAGQSEIISDELRDGIALRLAKKEQVMILLNRRGFHSRLKCRACNEVIRCPHCDLAMSYHKDVRKLKCHSCGFEMPVPRVCPSCHKPDGFTAYGFGTQKLEEEVQNMFPQAGILRMDADTTSKKDAHRKILEKFEKKEADILVGTQMIAKGLDYPGVTLVGIVNGDEGLNRTDFRSCEMTFDLLMQAAGRSGRSEQHGEVILQVMDPSHYAVQCTVRHDYDTFYRYEMQYRHAAMYPPYTYLISITVVAKTQKTCDALAMKMKEELHGDFHVIGVIELLRLHDQYRNRIILKGRNQDVMRDALRQWLENQKTPPEGVRIDVNPLVLD